MQVNTVTESQVQEKIKEQACIKVGEKTTVCLTILHNGFEIVTSSSCVDPSNYDHAVGSEYAKKKALDKLWELEGYLLQNKGKQDE
jgi:hypothetical protein